MEQGTKHLEDAIGALYATFARYRVGDNFAGCPHCVDPRESARLAAAPLRDLSIADLDHYAFKAMTTWGTAEAFKHFLPRLLELAAADPMGFLSLEVLFGKLAYAEWETWDPSEVLAVDDFLSALWTQTIQSDADDEDALDSVLSAIGSARSSIAGPLRAWLSDMSAASTRNLARFVLENTPTIAKKGILGNAPWQKEVLDWLRDGQPLEHLRKRSADLIGDYHGQPLSDSIRLLAVCVRDGMSPNK
jgi:hypothetical protein